MALYFSAAGYAGTTIYGEIERFLAPPRHKKLMWSAVVAFLVTWYCIISWMFMDSGGGGAGSKNVLIMAYWEVVHNFDYTKLKNSKLTNYGRIC